MTERISQPSSCPSCKHSYFVAHAGGDSCFCANENVVRERGGTNDVLPIPAARLATGENSIALRNVLKTNVGKCREHELNVVARSEDHLIATKYIQLRS